MTVGGRQWQGYVGSDPTPPTRHARIIGRQLESDWCMGWLGGALTRKTVKKQSILRDFARVAGDHWRPWETMGDERGRWRLSGTLDTRWVVVAPLR